MRASMTSIDHLASLLAPAVRLGGLQMPNAGDIDSVIERLEKRIRSGSANRVAADLQCDAVQRFWKTLRLETLKDARLVSFGLCLPAGPAGGCILEDSGRFAALLEGVDQWRHDARWFRRCYQGLVWNYFSFDIDADGVSSTARENWERLRGYLHRSAAGTVDRRANPDWVRTVVANRHLFGEAPCEPHIASLLKGDGAAVDLICERLGIHGASWFARRLIQAQVEAATQLDNGAFCALLGSLIEMLSGARALRDQGLACLLERYATLPNASAHPGLRDAALAWWGAPWEPSNALAWSGLTEAARSMAAEWIRGGLIDEFFADPADADGRRRAAFWKRFVKSMQKVECSDGVALVMTTRRAALVEFADRDLPLHGHDLRGAGPPDPEKPWRQSRPALALSHRDGIDGWRRWEQMFEAALKDRFDIRPGALVSTDATAFVDLADPAMNPDPGATEQGRIDEQRWHSASAGEDVHWQTAEAASVPYSRPDLEVLARVHSLRLVDETARGGRLRVRAGATHERIDERIARVLRRWGFQQAVGQEWCR
jgi:EH_Signature domain